MRAMISAQSLRNILDYSEQTGRFIWRERSPVTKGDKIFNRKFAGKVAGTLNNQGYVAITLTGLGTFKAHRLAWLYVYGELPPADIDHINLNRADNRLMNLRAATRSQNCANKRARADSQSGHKGVSPRGSIWVAQICVDRKVRFLGNFTRQEDAVAAYAQAAAEHFGEFARVA